MVETNDRRLPVGIQSFEEIREEGYLYVDKTDIICIIEFLFHICSFWGKNSQSFPNEQLF